MKDFQSADNIKQVFDHIYLPQIDVKNKVMEKIYGRNVKYNMKSKRKILIGVLITALLVFTAGFAVLQVWNLKDSGGSGFIFELLDKGDDRPPQEIYTKEFENLEPGKALVIMKSKNNPKPIIFSYAKPIVVKSIADLSNKVGSKFKFPAILPQEFEFVEGRMYYKYGDAHREEMINESRNTNEEYIIKVLEPTNEVWHYDLKYGKNYNEIIISVFFDYPQNNIQEVNRGHRVTKVNISNFEAIYAEHDGIAELTWLDDRNGDTIWYNIRTGTINRDTMNDLIKIGESLK